MSDINFVVGKGLTVGTTTISAVTGEINTSSNITVGNTIINGTTGNITIGNTTIDGSTGAIITSNLVVGSTTLATVATTGSYNDLIDKPVGGGGGGGSSDPASATVLGSVRIKGNITVDSNGNISITSTNVTNALGFTPVNSSIIGQANGVASLDSNGKLPLSQLDSSVVGALNYQGTWDASTNAPAIIPSTGTKGHYYVVSVAGDTTINGHTNWTVGDIIAFNGSVWNQIQGDTSDVSSVFGRTGAVTLQSSDVTGALGFTPYNSTNPSGYQTSSQVSSAISAAAYTLPTATTSTLGGIKVDGTSVMISNGVISSVSPVTSVAGRTGAVTLTTADIPNVGTLTINIVSKSVDYTLVLGDSGAIILHPSSDASARTFTIPANSSVAYPIGTSLMFVNQYAAGTVTISINNDTMRLAGAGTSGNRSLASNGMATAIKLSSTEWIISGTGLT